MCVYNKCLYSDRNIKMKGRKTRMKKEKKYFWKHNYHIIKAIKSRDSNVTFISILTNPCISWTFYGSDTFV